MLSLNSSIPLQRQFVKILSRCFSHIRNWDFVPVSGLTGVNWKASSDLGIHLLFRGQSKDTQELGIDRSKENEILKKTSAYNIAPRSFGLQENWLVLEWLIGKNLKKNELSLCALAYLLVNLHQVTFKGSEINIQKSCAFYWRYMDIHRLTSRALRLHRLLQKSKPPQTLKKAILHMDVHPKNIINTASGLRLIDWEYSTIGDIALELAVLWRNNSWNSFQMKELIYLYCYMGGYQKFSELYCQTNQWLLWVDYMMWLWYEVRWKQTKQLYFLQYAQKFLNNV